MSTDWPRTRPLSAYPAFAVSSLDRLASILEGQLGASIAKLPLDGSRIDAVANRARLQNSELWYCSYGMPLSVKFPDGDYVRLQMQHRGVGGTWHGKHLTPVTQKFACISRAEVEIDFAEDLEQLVWRLPKGKLEQRLALMTGRPVGYALEFTPTIDLATPQGAVLQQMFRCLVQAVEASAGSTSQLVVREIEQALIGVFLANTQHSGQSFLQMEPRRVSVAQVKRVEAHIAAHWNEAISIEDLVAVAGASSRSLFRSFKETRGCSPMEFVRRQRLAHARHMLENPNADTRVTEVALSCGFGDLGRFAKEFQRAFGVLPSELLARRRAMAVVA